MIFFRLSIRKKERFFWFKAFVCIPQTILLFLLLWISASCENRHMTILYAKPKPLGKVLELGIVAHDSIWQGRQGELLRKYALEKGIYTCLPITPADTVHFAGLHRNLIHLAYPPAPAQAGKVQKVLDQRAMGQTTQYVPLPLDSAKIADMLQYVWAQEKVRMCTYMYAFEATQSTALERWVGKHYDFKMRIPPNFQVESSYQNPPLLRLKTDRWTESHIVIVKTPAPASFPALSLSLQEYIWRTVWQKGYQAHIFIKKEKAHLPTLQLSAEALLETFEVK